MVKKLVQTVLALMALVWIPAGCSGSGIPELDWDAGGMVLLEAYTCLLYTSPSPRDA